MENNVKIVNGDIESEVATDNVCDDISEQQEDRNDDDNDPKVADKIIVLEDTEIPRQCQSSTTFTKVFVISLITGMLIHYVFME